MKKQQPVKVKSTC